MDVDCGLRTSDVPSVTDVLETNACCPVQCVGANCRPTQRNVDNTTCDEVALRTVNATYNATCRFQLSTVRAFCRDATTVV